MYPGFILSLFQNSCVFPICQKDGHFQLLISILQLLTMHVSGVQDKENKFAEGRFKNNNRRGRERKREQYLNQWGNNRKFIFRSSISSWNCQQIKNVDYFLGQLTWVIKVFNILINIEWWTVYFRLQRLREYHSQIKCMNFYKKP